MAPRKKPAAQKRLPKAAQLDVEKLRPDLDYARTNDRVSRHDAHITDHGKRLAKVENSADYWSGVSQRVEKLEKTTPTTTIVEQASGMSISICFLIHDLVVGALIGGGWLYWHTFGFGFPPGLK